MIGSRHCGNLVLDTKQLTQNFREPGKGLEALLSELKQSVNGLMSVGQQRNESQVAVGRKQHEQRKMLHTLTLTLMLRHFTKYQVN